MKSVPQHDGVCKAYPREHCLLIPSIEQLTKRGFECCPQKNKDQSLALPTRLRYCHIDASRKSACGYDDGCRPLMEVFGSRQRVKPPYQNIDSTSKFNANIFVRLGVRSFGDTRNDPACYHPARGWNRTCLVVQKWRLLDWPSSLREP